MSDAEKRKVFISFYQSDRAEVDDFIKKWATQENVFIPKVLGISGKDDFINSTNPQYVMQRIRELYLGDSTVTIVLLGSCTHSRRYVDWEIKASLTQGEDNIPNGLIGIILPSKGNSCYLPQRLKDNWNEKLEKCYARYYAAPTSSEILKSWIEDAYLARTARSEYIQNSQDMMRYNAQCKVCGITH